MLSGIGLPSQLKNPNTKTNIEVLVDLPVGRNLWDHPLCTVTASVNSPTMQTDLHAWSNGPEVAIFHKGDDHGKLPSQAHFDNRKPDIQHSCKVESSIHFVIWRRPLKDDDQILTLLPCLILIGSASIFDQSIANPAKNVAPFNGDGFTLAPVLNIPESVGWLELTSSDPIDPPRIFVNYYDKPSDLYRMISAVKLARKVIKSMKPSLNAKELGFKDEYGNWQSGDEMTDEEYELYIRAKVNVYIHCFRPCSSSHINATFSLRYRALPIKTYTSFHPCGTTKMAPRDNGGVVDHHLRVYGTKHLRVVDASIFPTIPSGNLNAPTGMVAWRASTLIIKDYMRRAGLA